MEAIWPIMDTVLSFLISAGIIAFGVWVVAGTIIAGWPWPWPLMGLLVAIVGLLSLYGNEVRTHLSLEKEWTWLLSAESY
jgi:hypothetical protein